jgi:hypothetical protein
MTRREFISLIGDAETRLAACRACPTARPGAARQATDAMSQAYVPAFGALRQLGWIEGM